MVDKEINRPVPVELFQNSSVFQETVVMFRSGIQNVELSFGWFVLCGC